MKIKTAVVIGIALLAVSALAGAQQTVAGAWTLTVDNLPMRMVLAQDGAHITGTLDYPHGAPFQLVGEFADGKLRFSSDSKGAGFSVHIEGKGALAEDGRLSGSIDARFVEFDEAQQIKQTRDQTMPWTAVRTPNK